MRHLRVLLVLTLAWLAGCADGAYRARYDAEKARYWAERGDIRFSLESNPQLRRGYAASGLRHADVAARAEPDHFPNAPQELRDSLREIQGRAQIRAGVAFLRAGRMDLAVPHLADAQERAPAALAREATWLRAKGHEELGELALARDRYVELFDLVLQADTSFEPGERLLNIPADFATLLRQAGETDLLASWADFGRRTYAQVAARWPGTTASDRARFLTYRLAGVTGDWPQAVRDLEQFEATAPTPDDRFRSSLNRAGILAVHLAAPADAIALLRQIVAEATSQEIQAIASLRLAKLEAGEDEEAALLAFAKIARDYTSMLDIAVEAEIRRAEILLSRGARADALQTLRRALSQYPDVEGSLAIPLMEANIQEQANETRKRDAAYRRGIEHYQRVLNGYPGDSRIGVTARRYLVRCLLATGDAETALQELELLYHLRGRSADGMQALLAAADVAAHQLQQPGLARRYLEQVLEEMPGSPSARAAEKALAGLGT